MNQEEIITSLETDDMADSRLLRYASLEDASAKYYQWQMSWFWPHVGQRVLEVGCGIGSITGLLGPRELIVSLDVEEPVLEYAKKRMADHKHCQFRLLDITSCTDVELDELKKLKFDTIICINVLEHIAEDQKAIERFFQVLGPGGKLLLLVPAHPLLYGKYDAVDGHHRRYFKRGLRALLDRCGFKPLFLKHFNAVGAIGWFVQYRLLQRSGHGDTQVGLMNRLLPYLRFVEERVPPLWGLSLIAVCTTAENGLSVADDALRDDHS